MVDGEYSAYIRMAVDGEWMAVDLGQTEHVNSMQVYLGQHSSGELPDFIIGVTLQHPSGSDPPTNASLYAVCARYNSSMSDDLRLVFPCSFPIFGRYVFLLMTTYRGNPLHVCELEVYAKPSPFMDNLALLKPTVQSGGHSPAHLAVDGNFDLSQCSSSGDMFDPWWAVVLQRETIVTHVSVTTCDIQANLVVGVTDTPIDASHAPSDYTLCAHYSGELPVGTSLLTCQPSVVSGRFLFIRRITATLAALTLSEVQVYSVVSPLPSTDPGQPDPCREFHSGDVIWSDPRNRKYIAAVRIGNNPPANCADIQAGGADTDGVYTIYPNGRPLQVYCDLTTDGGGWTVFQRRMDGSVDFYRGWADYKKGFGSTSGEFWLGNDNIHSLTSGGSQVLRIDLEAFDGETRFAEYSGFSIDAESNQYTLKYDAYLKSSNMGDSLMVHNNQPFSTKDEDHDSDMTDSCSCRHHGAWWYKWCHRSNLNAIYFDQGQTVKHAEGITWYSWKGNNYSFKKSTMKMRPAGFLDYVTVAVTDVDPAETRPSDLPETSYHVCAVVPSTFTGLARCDLTAVYGRYVFVKALPKTKLKLCEVEVYPYPLPNVALGKMALQSSTYGTTVAGFSVDGNMTTCAVCNGKGEHPWLLVDLRGHYQVVEVILVTGEHNGLDNFDVGVTGIPLTADKPLKDLTTADYHVCGVFVDMLPKYSRIRIPCESVRGRYVFVRMRTGYLSPMILCELEVYVQPPTLLINAARDMIAGQSSTAPPGGAMRAVDGKTTATCSFTEKQLNPWWRVDLALLHAVWHVTVTHFKHLVLRDFAIWMSIADTTVPPTDGTLCSRYSSPPWYVGVSHATCVQPPVLARYVSLVAPGKAMILMLCEVQVFGRLVTCPAFTPTAGETYKNTNCTSDKKVYNDTCEVSCELGYNLTSSDGVHKCTENGTWSNDATCELVRCPPITKSEGDIYNVTCTTDTKVYNDTCEVSCERGYNLTSSDGVHKCTENGTWSNDVTCEHITCEALPRDPHGKYTNVNCTEEKTFYNESCELECELGYKANGHPVQTCRLNGNWSSHIHCIVRLCPEVNDTIQARLVSGNGPFVPDTVLRFECNEGYELAEGYLELSCQKDGEWSGKAPNCTAIKCPVLVLPNNTEVEGDEPNAHVYNTTIDYRCAKGHDLIFGDVSRTCQSSKTWSNEAPVCRIVSCGPPAPVANAHASITDDSYLANITYTCKPGFKPEADGDWTRKCQEDKRWSGTAPLCRQILCKAPPIVANTSMTTDGLRVNDTATYLCLPGYRLRAGSLAKVCNEHEQWQNDDPECIEVHCGPPIKLNFTNQVTSGGDTVGGKVMYTCIHGYERLSDYAYSDL